MNANLVKSCAANLREWEPNPILVKELRQAVRSHVLTGALLLLLVALFLAAAASLSGQNIFTGRTSQMGQGMFNACLVMLAIASLVFIPLFTGVRLALERHKSDLMFVTPLPVTKLVHGKLLSGMYLAGLFFCVSAPFMAFSTLLRGLDLLTVQFVLLLLFAAVFIAVLAAIAIAVLPFHIFLKSFFGVAFGGGLVVLCGLLLIFFFGVVQSGVAVLVRRAGFWDGFMTVFGMGAFSVMVSYGFSISFIASHRRPSDPYGFHLTTERNE
jgi:hypothetical protein